MSDMAMPASSLLEERVIRKITWRLIPFLMLLYLIAFLDRINVGFAALTMNHDLGLTAEMFGLGSGIFFLGYFVFEVPSTVILHKRSTLLDRPDHDQLGLVSIATAFTQGPISFCVLRFLLGLAEAGFFPGIILYLSYWFPSNHRSVVTAMFMAAAPGCGTDRLACFGCIDGVERHHGTTRLAVGLPGRRHSRITSGPGYVLVSDRPTSRREVAGRRGARVADAGDSG